MLARNDPLRQGGLQRQQPAVSGPADDFDDDLGIGPEVPEEQEEQRPAPPAKLQPKRAPQRRKPQLTIVDLKKPEGLPYVFSDFPKQFAAGFKGKGHEVRDLRRLLEMYQRWQRRLFPHCSFQDFQEKLEKLGVRSETRDELHAMRTRLYEIVRPPQQQHVLDVDWQEEGGAADAAAGSDDDFLQQRELPGTGPMGGSGNPAGGAAAPVAAAGGAAGGDFPDDDELMEMQLDAQWDAVDEAFQDDWEPPAAAPPAPAAASMGPPPSSVAPTAAATTRMSGAAPAAAAGGGGAGAAPSARRKRALADWSDDDEDMPAQPHRKTAGAAASTAQEGPAAGAPPHSSPAAAAGAGDDMVTSQQPGPLTDSQLDQLLQETQLDAAAGLQNEHGSQQRDTQPRQPQQQQQQPEVDPAGGDSALPVGGLDEEELAQLLQDTAPAELDSQVAGANSPLQHQGHEQQQQEEEEEKEEEEGNLAAVASLQAGVGPLSETQLQELLEPTCVDQEPLLSGGGGGGATPAANSQQQQQQQQQQQTPQAADQHMLALLDDDFDDDE